MANPNAEANEGAGEVAYIPVAECKTGYLYSIDGRNASLGVYSGDGEFLVRRHKFGDVFIDTEDHHDQDGTVKPLRKLSRTPESLYADGNRITGCYMEGRLIRWLEEQYIRSQNEKKTGTGEVEVR